MTKSLFEISKMEFAKLFRKLEVAYMDGKEKPDEVFELYYDKLKYYDYATIELAIDAMLDDNNITRFPLVWQFKEAITKTHQHRKLTDQDLASYLYEDECEHCRDTGYITETRDHPELSKYPYKVVVDCPHCDIGRKMTRNWELHNKGKVSRTHKDRVKKNIAKPKAEESPF